MKLLNQYFYKLLSELYNFVSAKRELKYVRILQFFFLTVTILLATVCLLLPNYNKLDLDLRENGPWGLGRNAPIEIISNSNLEFLLEKQYENAQLEEEKTTALQFTRNYEVLSNKEDSIIKENLKENQKDKKTFSDKQNKNIIDENTSNLSFQNMLNNDLQLYRICKINSKNQNEFITCARTKIKRWANLNLEYWQGISNFGANTLSRHISHIVNSIFENYIILKKVEIDHIYKKSKLDTVRIQNIKDGFVKEEVDLPFKNVIQSEQLYYDTTLIKQIEESVNVILKNTNLNRIQTKALLRISRNYLYRLDGSRFDKVKTIKEMNKARLRINRGDYLYKIKKGELIVRNGDIITENIYKALKFYQNNYLIELLKNALNIISQQVIFLFFVIYFMLRLKDKRINDVNSILILFVTIWFFIITLFFLQKIWLDNLKVNEAIHFFGAWVPISGFAILLTIIFGENFSLATLLYMSYISFLASGYDGVSYLITTTTSLASLIIGTHIKKRVQFILIAFTITFIAIILVGLGYIYTNRAILDYYNINFWFTANFSKALKATSLAGLCSLAILGILPLYEAIFNIPTRFKLIELSDNSHPLLKSMFQKAPSTWLHTLMVAALTEKACEKLGLNAILARTGIYFHDIGKMQNAGFFVENQHLIPKPENIDKNDPNQAAKVIIDHVTDGVKMARKERLPKEVIAFIPEHHGTSMMSFFYHKALQKNRRKVQKEAFQYKGPKPQSVETAIAMIADSVEAASRSLDKYDKESLNNLVQKIILGKMSENQFDECNLTLGALNTIKESFVEVLISSYHLRPKYPEAKDTKDLEEQRTSKSNLKIKNNNNILNKTNSKIINIKKMKNQN